jgi:hypothetical protein
MYLRFDGVDDSLQTNSINFTSTDKMTVVAGVRKLSDAAQAIVVELSALFGTNNGTFTVQAPTVAGLNNLAFGSRGTASSGPPIAGYVSPISVVLTGVGNISGDIADLRVNGSLVSPGTADQGTGNYGNYPLFIGRRGGTTLPFNGRFYSLIVRGAQSTAGQITQTETFVNGKTKAY